MKDNKKQFKIFKAECKKWIKEFGLYGFSCSFIYKKLSKDTMAECILPDCFYDRMFTIALNSTLDFKNYTDREIRKAAFHEVMEILLYKLGAMASGEYMAVDGAIIDEKHNVIHRLEHVIFDEGELK